MSEAFYSLKVSCLRCSKTFTVQVLAGAVVTISPMGYCSPECYCGAMRTKEATSKAGLQRAHAASGRST